MKNTQTKLKEVDRAIQDMVDKINNTKGKNKPAAPRVMTPAELDEAVRDMAYEMSLTTLVIKEIAAETGVNLKECVERARVKLEALTARAEQEKKPEAAHHPAGATIFGGDQ